MKKVTHYFTTLQTSKVLYESVGKNTICVDKSLLSFLSMYKCDCGLSYLAQRTYFKAQRKIHPKINMKAKGYT